MLAEVLPLDIELVVLEGNRVFQSRRDGMEIVGFDHPTPESVQGAGLYLSVDRGKPQQGPVCDLPALLTCPWPEAIVERRRRVLQRDVLHQLGKTAGCRCSQVTTQP